MEQRNMNQPKRITRLSQVDAFFVAYQEKSGILMQLGSETDLLGILTRDHFLSMLRSLTSRWPQLGQRISKGISGLFWDDKTTLDGMFHYTTDKSVMEQWRNKTIDPFREPPLQVLWVDQGTKHSLVFRAHHCVMDGEAFLKMCIEAAKALSLAQRGEKQEPPPEEGFTGLSIHDLKGEGRILDLIRYVRWLSKEARNPSKGSTYQRQCTPGEIGIQERAFNPVFMEELRQFAKRKGSSLMWMCAGAWIKALYQWNVLNREESSPFLSLEFPVSIRRNARTRNAIGNLISPLTLMADARNPIEEIALSLQSQTLEGIRKRFHFGVPLFTLPGKYVPWSIFRRLAVNQTTSGFATSHFSWFEYKEDPKLLFSENSGGGLELVTQRIYTPVCLHMGAALSALISPQEPKLFITYRKTGFSEEDIRIVGDFLTQGLQNLVLKREALHV
jgi:hypothetical protein